MKTMFYPRLAWHGITKNRETYLPYLITCIGTIMMYYILSFLSRNDSVGAMKGGNDMQIILRLGTTVVAVFAFIFLFYTYSFLIRKRKKEFGLYNILGMGKRNIARILLCENLMLSVGSLVPGLLCGILFSKLAELCAANMLHADADFVFRVDAASILHTVALFAAVYLLIFCNALRQIHVSNPIALLHSDRVGEKPPKARWLLALLGVAVLGTAYYLSCSIEDPMSAIMTFFAAVLMVIFATYLLFLVGSVAFCRLLQKNKRYYYQTSHFVSVSSMIYRMKRNGASLASICILSTMVLVMISSSFCLYIGKEDNMRQRYPREIEIETYSSDPKLLALVRQTADEAAQQQGYAPENRLEYRYLQLIAKLEGNQLLFTYEDQYIGSYRVFQFYTVADYNRYMGTDLAPAQDEAILYLPKGTTFDHDTVSVGEKTYRIITRTNEPPMELDQTQTLSTLYFFLPDEAALQQIYRAEAAAYGEESFRIRTYYGFDLSCPDDAASIATYEKISNAVLPLTTLDTQEKLSDTIFDRDPPTMTAHSAVEKRSSFYALYGGLFLIGILLSVVFLGATVLIMYYKQISEGYEDCSRFAIMQKVGMTKREIRKSVNSQVLTVFGLPLLTAGVHVGFAMPIITKMLRMFGLVNTRLFVLVAIGCFLLFAVFYILVYHITSRSYYHIVSEKTE